jgi:hypothetical protein
MPGRGKWDLTIELKRSIHMQITNSNLEGRVKELEAQVDLLIKLADYLRQVTTTQGEIIKAVATKLGVKIAVAAPKSDQQ